MMKNMFVSMGNATTTETEAWVSQAKTAQNAPTTSVSMYRPARPSSAVLPGGRTSRTRTYSSGLTPHGGTKQRPHSAVTESDTHVTDSGIWSRTGMFLITNVYLCDATGKGAWLLILWSFVRALSQPYTLGIVG